MAEAPQKTVAEQFTGPQLLQLASNLLSDGQRTEAIDVLKMGVEAGAYSLADALPVMAQAAESRSRYDTSNAVDMMRQMIAGAAGEGYFAVPDDLQVKFCMSVIRLAQLSATDSDQSAALWCEAAGSLAHLTPTPETHYLLGLCHLALAQPLAETGSAVRACLDASAGAHAGAWLLLATLLSQQGKRVEAQGALSAGVACGTTAWAGALLRAQAQLFVADGTLGKAQASVQQAIQSGLTPECIAQSWAVMGRMYLGQGLLEDAQSCTQALKQAGLSGTSWAGLLSASIDQHTGKDGAALAVLEEGLACHPDDPHLLKAIGLAHCSKDSQTDVLLAQVNLDRAVLAMPLDGEACHALGNIYFKVGLHAEAERLQVRALKGLCSPTLINAMDMPLAASA